MFSNVRFWHENWKSILQGAFSSQGPILKLPLCCAAYSKLLILEPFCLLCSLCMKKASGLFNRYLADDTVQLPERNNIEEYE